MSLRGCTRIFSYFASSPLQSRCMSFKSAISLDKLYPQQDSTIKPFCPPVSSDGKFTGYIPTEDLVITYSRASGPGGQHVNKTNTKVDLRFHVQSAKWINEDVKNKLMTKHITKITKEGFLVIRSERTRMQLLNLADAMERLRTLIYQLELPEIVQPSVDQEERMRKNQEKAVRIRLMEKRQRSMTKKDRQSPGEF